MRLISQDRRLDVPYDCCAIIMTRGNTPTEHIIRAKLPDGQYVVIGVYDSKTSCDQALINIWKAYHSSEPIHYLDE